MERKVAKFSKGAHRNIYLNIEIWQISPKSQQKICHQDLLKLSQSGHTEYYLGTCLNWIR